MRRGAPCEVLVSIQDDTARRTVLAILRDRAVPTFDLVANPQLQLPPVRCRAIIFDLFPWNQSAIGSVQAFRHRYPFAQVLLYYPPVSGLREIAQACSRIAGCELKRQQTGQKGHGSLKETVHRLLDNGPVHRAHAVLETVAAGFIKEFPTFVDHVVAAIAHPVTEPAGHLVGVVARSLGKSLRRIEQICTERHWPRPKELVDWTILLWLTSVAQLGGITTAAAARQAGISGNRLHRIRLSVLPEVTFGKRLRPREEFYLAMTSLTELCRGTITPALPKEDQEERKRKMPFAG